MQILNSMANQPIVVNNFHLRMREVRDLFMNVNEIGLNGCHLIKKFREDKRANQLNISGDMYDPIKMKFIMSALRDTRVGSLILWLERIFSEGIKFLADGLKFTNITSLILYHSNTEVLGIKYLADVLIEICIIDLTLDCNNIGDEGVQYLAKGLKNSNVISLSLRNNGITSIGIRYLADALKDSQLTKIILGNQVLFPYPNQIADEGVKYLFEHLRRTNISYLNINSNCITNDGAKYIARHLRNTCLTTLHLRCNKIDRCGILHLIQSLQDTQIVDINVGPCDRLLEIGVLSENKATASKMKDDFEKLVVQNTQTNDLEFIVPSDIEHLDVVEYLNIVQIIAHHPMIRGHLFDMISMNGCTCYPKIINKINEFVVTVQKKFNTFFDNIVLKLVPLFDNSYFVNLVRQCENMKLPQVVENLLLHRLLYCVDEKSEVLHPYIYKMLAKYGMPLYYEQLEPNKKGEIIYFFQNHPEFDDAEEILNFLKSGHSN